MQFELVVVGASLGGFHALEVLLGGLPGNFPLPLAIAQHRSVDSTDSLVTLLSKVSALPVGDAEDKQTIAPSRVYIAPADYHLLVEEGHFALSTGAPVQSARPSIDVLFETAADAYRERTIAVLLSGASADGAQGILMVKQRKGLAVVQDPASARSGRMPEAALALAQVDKVLPLAEIAPFLLDLVDRV